MVEVWRRAGLVTLEDDGTPQLPVVRTRISVAIHFKKGQLVMLCRNHTGIIELR